MSDNVPGISDVPVPLGLAESLPLCFLLLVIASFVTEGMSRRVGLLFSLTAIPCYLTVIATSNLLLLIIYLQNFEPITTFLQRSARKKLNH